MQTEDTLLDAARKTIIDFATKESPLNADEICQYLQSKELGSTLTRLVRLYPDIHRSRPVVKFGRSFYVYWYDSSNANPEFRGLLVPKGIARAVCGPKVQAASIRIPLSTGELTLSPTDARLVFTHLKEIYQ